MKRLLSFVLVLCLAFGLMPLTALADTDPVVRKPGEVVITVTYTLQNDGGKVTELAAGQTLVGKPGKRYKLPSFPLEGYKKISVVDPNKGKFGKKDSVVDVKYVKSTEKAASVTVTYINSANKKKLGSAKVKCYTNSPVYFTPKTIKGYQKVEPIIINAAKTKGTVIVVEYAKPGQTPLPVPTPTPMFQTSSDIVVNGKKVANFKKLDSTPVLPVKPIAAALGYDYEEKNTNDGAICRVYKGDREFFSINISSKTLTTFDAKGRATTIKSPAACILDNTAYAPMDTLAAGFAGTVAQDAAGTISIAAQVCTYSSSKLDINGQALAEGYVLKDGIPMIPFIQAAKALGYEISQGNYEDFPWQWLRIYKAPYNDRQAFVSLTFNPLVLHDNSSVGASLLEKSANPFFKAGYISVGNNELYVDVATTVFALRGSYKTGTDLSISITAPSASEVAKKLAGDLRGENNNDDNNNNNNNNNGGSTDENSAALGIINARRSAAGASPLALDAELTAAANLRATEIAKVFSHDRPDGTSCFTVSSKARGENIAYNYSASYDDVMALWMNSQGHKENILRSTFTTVGIGHYQEGSKHYWVQLFG